MTSGGERTESVGYNVRAAVDTKHQVMNTGN